ncbi:glycoside hydrolase, catalytic domain-containing protein [Tanacetum coccineum]
MALATHNLANTSANYEPIIRQYVENDLAQIQEMIFPKFYREDVLGWIFKCDQFFLIDNTPKEENVKIIYVHLFDKVLLWHRQLIKSKRENVTWTKYKDAITLSFGSVYDDPMALFKNAKYDKSTKEYQDTFDNLLSMVEVSEEHAISLYLGGSPTELEMSVRMFKPKILSDAYCLTTLQEATLEAVKKKSRPFMNQTTRRFGVSNLNGKEEEEYLDADESLIDAVSIEVQAHISLNALSGSTHNFLDVNMAKRIGCKVWSTCPLAVSVPGGKQMVTVSECKDFQWQLYGHTFTADVMLLPLGECDMVLGIQWLSTLGDIRWNFQEKQIARIETMGGAELMMMTIYPNTGLYLTTMEETMPIKAKVEPRLQEVIDVHAEVFAVPNKLPPMRTQDHRILLMPGTQPENIRPYRHPPVQKGVIEAIVKKLLDSGVIKHNQSSFASPVVMVKNKDNSWRMCVDYRQLNKHTIKDKFCIPIFPLLKS